MKWGKTSHIIWASMVCETGYGLEMYVGLIAGLESFPKKQVIYGTRNSLTFKSVNIYKKKYIK
jgi:hypothetical protein